MANSWLDNKLECYIEFRVNEPTRYEIFLRFFMALRSWTQRYTAQTKEETITSRSVAAFTHMSETQETRSLNADDTTSQRRQFGKPEEWLLAFRPQDLENLGLPQHMESIQHLREWQGLSRRERRKYIKTSENTEALYILADFVDMLRYWQQIEFELGACDMQGTDLARLSYVPFDFPFKGKEALEELLMFFSFFSIIKDTCR